MSENFINHDLINYTVKEELFEMQKEKDQYRSAGADVHLSSGLD